MKYKLPKRYESSPCIYESGTFNTFESVVPTVVLSVEEFEPEKFGEYVYDLTVEDNHNYFAQNILVHNCSATLFITKGKNAWNAADYGVCSRNWRLDPKTSRGSWIKVYERCETQMRKALALEFPMGFAVQGEIIGPGIQKNKYQRKDYEFYVFNVILTNGKRLSLHSFEDFCKRYGFVTVPILDRAFKLTHTLPEILEYSKGNSVLSGVEVMREGIVIRSWDQSVSFKVINNEFLLAERDEEEYEQQNKPAKEEK
jgi:hypothetical protein